MELTGRAGGAPWIIRSRGSSKPRDYTDPGRDTVETATSAEARPSDAVAGCTRKEAP
jgi:hypothetical protein